jgi:hypothetical protein
MDIMGLITLIKNRLCTIKARVELDVLSKYMDFLLLYPKSYEGLVKCFPPLGAQFQQQQIYATTEELDT